MYEDSRGGGELCVDIFVYVSYYRIIILCIWRLRINGEKALQMAEASSIISKSVQKIRVRREEILEPRLSTSLAKNFTKSTSIQRILFTKQEKALLSSQILKTCLGFHYSYCNIMPIIPSRDAKS